MMHARINEFFSSRNDRITAAKGGHSRGGYTLRDTLFALSKRNRGGLKSMKKSKTASSSSKPASISKSAAALPTSEACMQASVAPSTSKAINARTISIRRKLVSPAAPPSEPMSKTTQSSSGSHTPTETKLPSLSSCRSALNAIQTSNFSETASAASFGHDNNTGTVSVYKASRSRSIKRPNKLNDYVS